MLNKVMKKQQMVKNALIDEEATKRAEKIDIFGDKLLKMASEEEMTINDLQVVLNTLTKQLELVFISHKVSDFIVEESK